MKEKKITTESKEEPAQFQVIDRRHFADPEAISPDAVPAGEKPRYPSFVEELMGKLQLTERSFEEKKAQMQAEIQRTRARLESDYAKRLEIEKQKQILPLLEVLDNLERAIGAGSKDESCQAILDGIQITTNLFHSKLHSMGIEPILLLHQPYDPNVGQAVGVVAVSDPNLDGVVVDEVLRGYRCGDQLLRPAQVRVGRFAGAQPEEMCEADSNLTG